MRNRPFALFRRTLAPGLGLARHPLPRARRHHRRAGQLLVITACALTTLLACAALTVDAAKLLAAVQISQEVADSAALAAAPLLADPEAALAAAQAAVAASNRPDKPLTVRQALAQRGALTVRCDYSGGAASDLVYFAPRDTIPGYGTLGPAARGITATCHIDVGGTLTPRLSTPAAKALRPLYPFPRRITRQALAVYAPAAGAPVLPLWVSANTGFARGEAVSLRLADGPDQADQPGVFGFLQLPARCKASWVDVISGGELREFDWQALYLGAGETAQDLSGPRTSRWAAALEERLRRAKHGWADDSFADHAGQNPRVLLVPMVQSAGDTAPREALRIQRFAAFWLTDLGAGGEHNRLTGRFIQYVSPEGQMQPFGPDTGIYSYRLVG